METGVNQSKNKASCSIMNPFLFLITVCSVPSRDLWICRSRLLSKRLWFFVRIFASLAVWYYRQVLPTFRKSCAFHAIFVAEAITLTPINISLFDALWCKQYNLKVLIVFTRFIATKKNDNLRALYDFFVIMQGMPIRTLFNKEYKRIKITLK